MGCRAERGVVSAARQVLLVLRHGLVQCLKWVGLQCSGERFSLGSGGRGEGGERFTLGSAERLRQW